jgi:hypothetical protein
MQGQLDISGRLRQVRIKMKALFAENKQLTADAATRKSAAKTVHM